MCIFSKNQLFRLLKYFLLTAVIFAFLFLLASCDTSIEYAVVSENNLSSDGFYYTLYENNTAIITGTSDPSKKVLKIPATVDSYKVTEIGKGAFDGNSALQYVEIAEGIQIINANAFRQCYSLLRIDIAATVTEIGNYAFDSCEKLCEVTRLSKVKTIGAGAFYRCISLSVIEFPESLETIGDEAFFGCKAIVKITLPKKIKSAGFGSFAQCQALTYVDLGGLTEIPDAMFEKNSSLLQIDIGSKVTRIGERAFRECRNLGTVSIGKNVSYIGGSAFTSTKWLINCTDEFLVVGNGVLLKYTGKSATVTVPNTVKVISDAFSGSGKIEEIVIGKSVTLISQYAFSGCTKLKSVQILGKVKKIENCAFLGCVSLESIRLPSTITEIGENAFSNCSSLNTVTYEGTSESWYKIPVAKGNLNLQAAEMIFEGKK